MALNGSDCDNNSSLNITDEQRLFLISARCSTAFLSAIACSVALGLLGYFKLYKWFNYRLVLYLLVSVLVYSVINFMQLPVAWYDPANKAYVGFCQFIAFGTEYIIWNLLLLTVFIVIQLFVLVMCFKELKSIERQYVIFSCIFPLLFSWIPFVTDSYGPSGPWCWIKKNNEDCSAKVGVTQQYVLWYGPLIFIMCTCLVAIMVISLTLCYHACKNKHPTDSDGISNIQAHENTEDDTNTLVEYDNSVTYKKSLKETLTLLAYPVIFFCINILALIDRTVQAASGDSPFWLKTLHAFWNTLWGFFAAMTFIIHLLTLGKERRTKLRERKRKERRSEYHESTYFEDEGSVTATHVTEYVAPEED